MRLLPGLLLLGLLVLATFAGIPRSREAAPFGLTESALAATLALGADHQVAGRGDLMNFTIWLNVTGGGQFQRTWVNLTFNTAADPNDNSLVQGPMGWAQPSGCVVLVASGWSLAWECLGLRAGSYTWGVPASVPSNATVGRYQRVMASSASETNAGTTTASTNTTIWIAGAVVRLADIDSAPVDSARAGDIVEFWINATNEASVNTTEAANGTGTAFNVTVTIHLDPGLRLGSGSRNLTTRLPSLPPSAVLSVNLETIVAANLTAGTVVGLSVELSYQDFNGHAIGPLHAESPPIYVVQANVLSTPNLVAGAAIGLGAILTTLVLLLYVGQRKILIDEAFFMTKGGVLIRHVSRKPELKKDDDIVASMFVAIQEFVRDSFRREASLDSVAFGRRRAAVVRGELTILAAVISHGDVDYVIPELLAAVRAIETKYWDLLVNWAGNMSQLAGVDKELNRLLGGAFRSPWRVQLT